MEHCCSAPRLASSTRTTCPPPSTATNPLHVHPNPGTNRFFITIPASWSATLRVYDTYGRHVLSQQYPGPAITVDASTWCAGVYHVVLRDQGGEVLTLKWVKE